jgi:hypothetical protein
MEGGKREMKAKAKIIVGYSAHRTESYIYPFFLLKNLGGEIEKNEDKNER